MTLIIFIIVLGILVLVHELGHFLFAKKAGVHVEEFGIGYPPKATTLGTWWGTRFSLNWVPFGGFVKILGENYDKAQGLETKIDNGTLDDSSEVSNIAISPKRSALNFVQVSRKWQALILAGGVLFNVLFAWILFSLAFMIGIPTPVDNEFGGEVKNPSLTVISVLQNSPAKEAGLKSGDKIISISFGNEIPLEPTSPEIVSDFINKSIGDIKLDIIRGEKLIKFNIIPDESIIEDKRVIGISMDVVGELSLPPHKAVYEGAKVTARFTYLTVEGLYGLVKDAFKGEADMSQVTGPVGIVGLVGDASRLGFAYLVTFTALISINLAIINMIPFPALDGGRLLFVAIEGITKKPINPKFAMVVNTVGFGVLILLMIVVTYRDIVKLF
jgi:regulator of sigma E protease